MTERLADVTARLEGIRQLGQVVNAMRGIAAARAQQARAQLGAVDAYAGSIAAAIGRALALPGAVPGVPEPAARPAAVVFCAEQGFAGAFSERVLGEVGAEALFLVGTRGIALAGERGIRPAWAGAMPAQTIGVPRLADRIGEALYGPIATGEIDRLDAVYTEWHPAAAPRVVRARLFPLQTGAFAPGVAEAPVVNLASAALLADLAAAYMHARLCHAALHAFAAENEARMAAMAAARAQVDRREEALRGLQRQVRQEEITAEIVELAAGETASRGPIP